MPQVLVYERAKSFPDYLARRGHHIVYRAEVTNQCPGCGRSQWHIGRISAECAYCSTAIALAEARLDDPKRSAGISVQTANPPRAAQEKRRFARMEGEDRELELLVDGAPANFALQNISAGGVMGKAQAHLSSGAEVLVRFESGVLVPATVRWADGGFVGLQFASPVLIENSPQ